MRIKSRSSQEAPSVRNVSPSYVQEIANPYIQPNPQYVQPTFSHVQPNPYIQPTFSHVQPNPYIQPTFSHVQPNPYIQPTFSHVQPIQSNLGLSYVNSTPIPSSPRNIGPSFTEEIIKPSSSPRNGKLNSRVQYVEIEEEEEEEEEELYTCVPIKSSNMYSKQTVKKSVPVSQNSNDNNIPINIVIKSRRETASYQ